MLQQLFRNRWFWAAMIVVPGLALVMVFNGGRQSGAAVKTAVATRGDIERLVTATGILQPREYVDVGAQVSGQLDVLHVQVGDTVIKGELLAEIDATVYAAKVDSPPAPGTGGTIP